MQWQTQAFEALTNTALYDFLKLRQQVFIVEQNCIYPDLDDKDQSAFHMLAYEGQCLRAYQRCLPPGISYRESSLGRVIVDPLLRGQNLGIGLVQRGIAHNLRRWPESDICISAQSHLQNFYAGVGFISEGDEYMEDGIPHRKMRRVAHSSEDEARSFD